MRKRRKPAWKPIGPTMVCGACGGSQFLIRMEGKHQVAEPCKRCHGYGRVEISAVDDRRQAAAGE